MKLIKTAVAALVLAFALALPAAASAGEQILDADFNLEAQSGKFLKDGFKAANWSVDNSVRTADPYEPVILPSKVIDLTMPAGDMTFNPGDMPVCPEDQIGPGKTSVPVPTMVARCPDSVLGNGTAKFVLNRNNLSPQAILDGVLVVFNGGLRDGRPLMKVYAYSYDTSVGIYTEAALQTDGGLHFEVPQLTSDSSVTELNLAIPSKDITLNNWGPGSETVMLPGGVKKDYVQAKCSTGSFPWSADFTFGTRDTDNKPTSPDTYASDSGVKTCTGVSGQAKLGKVKVKGPKNAKRGKTATYKVTVKNAGGATAKGVKVQMSGKGVKAKKSIGNIPAGKSKTVKLKAKFKKAGKVKATFKVTSKNAGKKTAKTTVKVK